MSTCIPAGWSAAIEQWVEFARCAGAPRSTLTTRRQHLEHAARRVGVADPWQVKPGDLLAYVGSQSWQRETRRGHRSTLRVFYAWAVESGFVVSSPAVGLPSVKPSPPRPRPTPDSGLRFALAGADERGRLLVRLAAEAGLRRAEAAQVHAHDLWEDLAGWSLLVHGKGDRDRLVPLSVDLALALRARALRTGGGFLFPGSDGGHLSPRWVGKIVGDLLPEGWTMHSLRHRFASRAYAHAHDVFAVQELLGHASPVTTRRYVSVDADRLRATVVAAAG